MRRLAIVLGLAFASCSDPICGCPPIGYAAWAVIDGVVVDAQAAAVEGAQVAPVGTLGIECSMDGGPVAADPVPAVTDANGRFTMTVWTGQVGKHCVDFEVSSPTLAVADTVLDVATPFVFDYVPADTLMPTFTVTW
jgi:hypothetical protein